MDRQNRTITIFAYCAAAIAVSGYIFVVFGFPKAANQIAGFAIGIAGFALWLAARIQLDNYFSLRPKAGGIVRNGLYSKFRHPIYLFSSLTWLGLVIYAGDWRLLAPLAAIVVLQAFRARQEEAALAKKFPQEFTEYKKSTLF